MKISVAFIVYNGSNYMRTQLDSIIAQSYKVDEIIVVEDASTDDTIEILNNYSNLESTLTTDITTFYDSYDIYVNQYDKIFISNIKIPKFIFTYNGVKYLNLMNTYITDEPKVPSTL